MDFQQEGMVSKMKNGFIKVAAASPDVKVADCDYNVEQMISVARGASSLGVKILVFPELSVTSASCGDLFSSTALLNSACDGLVRYIDATADSDMVSVVGFPYRTPLGIYNCLAVCQKGNILGIAAKSLLSSSERRVFSSGDALTSGEYVTIKGDIFAPILSSFIRCDIPCANAMFEARFDDGSIIEECCRGSVIAISAASPETVSSAKKRRELIKSLSANRSLGIVYANAGYGESSTDHVYAAHNIICENGELLAEALPFELDINPSDERIIISELDVEALSCGAGSHKTKNPSCHNEIEFDLAETLLTRRFAPLPFIPENEDELYECAETILKIQSSGLRRRMEAAYAKKLIIGISGGLDSTLALLVAAKACEDANRPKTDIIGITMPCFGTTSRTKNNAEILCRELGIEFRTVMIGESVKLHLSDIGHDIENRNIVYENAQARERTQVLMDIANAENGLVVGTGDMSELALGWATYNGDHMSMYGVNASIPKTLVRALTAHCAETAKKSGNTRLSEVLYDIIDTPVSPELLPADGENIKQRTEDLVGPYEIHDFYLYYMLKYGFSPEKLFRMACHALGSSYSPEVLLKWLEVFIKRFFSQQYKRSCLPDGPAVSELSLSPRGGLSMPSDASSAIWLAEIKQIKSKLDHDTNIDIR